MIKVITYETLYEKFKNCDTEIISEIDENGNIIGYKYKNILERVENVSKELIKHNINNNDNCVICCQDGVDFVVYYLAIFKLNGVAILIDEDTSEEELNNILSKIDINVIMTDSTGIDFFKNRTHTVINVNTNDYIINEEVSNNKINNDEAKTVIFSSGTTSSKSGIIHKTSNMYEMIKYTNYRYKCIEGDRFITIVPNSHIYGLSLNTIFCTYLATKVYYLKRLDAKIILKAFKDVKPKYFSGVAKMSELFENMIKNKMNNKLCIWFAYFCYIIRKYLNINIGKKIFKKVFNIFGDLCLITAGSPLDIKTQNFLYGIGFNIIQFYGTTETGVPIICTEDMKKYTYGMGKLMLPSQIKVKEETNELLIKNDFMLLGYIEKDRSINDVLDEDGWINTGDIVKVVNNNFYVIGRTKESIVLSSGEKVSPSDIEFYYKNIEGVEEYAICGILNDSNCDDIHMFIVAKKDFDETEIKKSIRKISSTLSSNMRIKYIHFVNEIPKTAIGKTRRYLLKDIIENN